MMDMLLVALRANQIIKAATQTLTKTELDNHSRKGSPLDDGKIVGALSVSADATMVENGMVLRTSRFRFRDFHSRPVFWCLALPEFEERDFYQTLGMRQLKRG
jgi:hypothetical protein